jgi:hypothetical protein
LRLFARRKNLRGQLTVRRIADVSGRFSMFADMAKKPSMR